MTEWSTVTRSIPDMRATEYTLLQAGKPMTYQEVIQGWRTSTSFRDFYIDILVRVSFTAAFWETPAVTRSTLHRPYRFILNNSVGLATVRPDTTTFQQHFKSTSSSIASFHNLGRTSRLIAPKPDGDRNFAHLLAFLRDSKREQAHDLFESIGREVDAALDDRPLWVSTSGLGVYWTHVRLDRTPKYYTYYPYRKWPITDDVVDHARCSSRS